MAAPPAASHDDRSEAAMLKLVQRGLQRLFLVLEKAGNAVFGGEANPLYHLGAIAYFLFWLVLASGLYLYIFFKTGVSEAYGSVEALTHEQWYLGGVMRSVHRYASDGMVLAMGLHLLRHFAFDRYRGFRWFSWFTGLVVLWLVYISGINGYMLPWDRLAQFVTIATAEWLDWLPVFRGALVRNFIYEGAVNDRLFSLLSFLHIGFPLAILALLWVHTSRVPGAKTTPPRPVIAWLSATLIALSLAQPVVSQGPADLASVAPVVALDWFYLPVFPLFYSLSVGTVWLIIGGATAVVALLPWLPPKRGQRAYQLSVRPDQRVVTARPGETLLDAVLREGIAFPFECRNGGCGVCKCTVLAGEVDPGVFQDDALTPQERAQGKVLACCSTPRSDVTLQYVPRAAPRFAVGRHRAEVVALTRLSYDVMQVQLRVLGEAPLRYVAGQYINILLPDGQRRAFSFASAPDETQTTFDLQIRLVPGGRFTPHVFADMHVGEVLDIEGPLGAFVLRDDSTKPIVFVAGATGFAPVKSMLEQAFRDGVRRPMVLYWGVRSRRDLYLGDLAERWAAEHDNFRFVPVLSDPQPEDHWTGRTGLVHQAILADYPDLSGYQVYACGSVGMVAAAHPAFVAQGLSEDDCFSDAFRLTPHKPQATAQGELVRLGGTA
jgi:NAD(P)H-flavin reductase/ferredoxin